MDNPKKYIDEIALKEIIKLKDENPNDMDFGKKARAYLNNIKETNK
jgi:hypothetical protein